MSMPRTHPPAVERPAPQTDPTDPYAQETVGVNETARWANERAVDEPGRTEHDRDERAQALGSHALPNVKARSRQRASAKKVDDLSHKLQSGLRYHLASILRSP